MVKMGRSRCLMTKRLIVVLRMARSRERYLELVLSVLRTTIEQWITLREIKVSRAIRVNRDRDNRLNVRVRGRASMAKGSRGSNSNRDNNMVFSREYSSQHNISFIR